MDKKKIESESVELSEELLEQISGGEEAPVTQVVVDSENRPNKVG
jgi:hypothetical protein